MVSTQVRVTYLASCVTHGNIWYRIKGNHRVIQLKFQFSCSLLPQTSPEISELAIWTQWYRGCVSPYRVGQTKYLTLTYYRWQNSGRHGGRYKSSHCGTLAWCNFSRKKLRPTNQSDGRIHHISARPRSATAGRQEDRRAGYAAINAGRHCAKSAPHTPSLLWKRNPRSSNHVQKQ